MRTKIKVPKRGDKRIVTRFLWFPKTIGDTRIWLERASYLQKYDYYYKSDGVRGFCSDEPFWQDMRWVG